MVHGARWPTFTGLYNVTSNIIYTECVQVRPAGSVSPVTGVAVAAETCPDHLVEWHASSNLAAGWRTLTVSHLSAS